jgi:predicted enzyme related to lactoylglutathione lyase
MSETSGTSSEAGTVAHFAINSDDVAAAQRFYAAVFAWRFDAWGPPGFFHIRRADGSLPGPIGALQQRRELLPGMPQHGFECTVAVDDVAATVTAVRAAGGRVLMEPVLIPGVGELAFFADLDGNVCGAMRYLDSSS